jgi:hypothetical protein
MRFSIMLAVVALAGCAGQAPEEPPEHQVKLDSSNIVEAQKAGYKIVNENGEKRYCKRDLMTGSHVRYTTTCLTEKEWQEMIDASRRSVEAMSRTRPPLQGK